MQTGSGHIYQAGMTPNTKAAITSRNKIYSYSYGLDSSKPTQIGVVGTFDPSHSRSVEPIRGIGFGDQIAELVPSVSEPVTISISRTLLYLSNLFQCFGYGGGVDGIVRDLKHHKWPFDIKQELVLPALEAGGGALGDLNNATSTSVKCILTWYEGCWITSYTVSYPSDSTIVTENVDISVTDVTDGAHQGKYNDGDNTGLANVSLVTKPLTT